VVGNRKASGGLSHIDDGELLRARILLKGHSDPLRRGYAHGPTGLLVKSFAAWEEIGSRDAYHDASVGSSDDAISEESCSALITHALDRGTGALAWAVLVLRDRGRPVLDPVGVVSRERLVSVAAGLVLGEDVGGPVI
jgi:hypothetical protein